MELDNTSGRGGLITEVRSPMRQFLDEHVPSFALQELIEVAQERLKEKVGA